MHMDVIVKIHMHIIVVNAPLHNVQHVEEKLKNLYCMFIQHMTNI